MLERSAVEKCERRVLKKSLAENRSVGEECCRGVLYRSVDCREVLGKSVVEKCWRRVL